VIKVFSKGTKEIGGSGKSNRNNGEMMRGEGKTDPGRLGTEGGGEGRRRWGSDP